jgi:integrase
MKRAYRNLAEPFVRALVDFPDLVGSVLWDQQVKGLKLFVGRRLRWEYYRQYRKHGGKLKTTSVTLGYWPEVNLKEARNRAMIQAGKIAAGHIRPGQKSALKVAAAIDQYIEHLRDTAKAGSRWPANVVSIAKVHIVPEFGTWLLWELSDAPAVVADWHKKISRKSPAAANHAARVLRAAYRYAARLDRTLPPALPTSAVTISKEERSQAVLTDFRAWGKAWARIENPVRRAYQLCGLLSGARPGELARLKWSDVLPGERCLVIRGAKASNDIRVPMSRAIAGALKLARDHGVEGNPHVFPARAGGHIVKFDADDLPAWGMMYRRTWRTLAADLGVDELIAHFCLGHVPAGISRGYVAKMMLASGQGMRSAQRRVSREIMRRLGLPSDRRP